MSCDFFSCLSKDEEFEAIDADKSHKLAKKEMHTFIEHHVQLFETLALNLDLDRELCKDIATDVAFNIAGGGGSRELSYNDFKKFKKQYAGITSPGNQEFVFRTVFRVYDKDGNGYLDSDELDSFIDLFFKADSFVRKDDPRLKGMRSEDLKKLIIEKCDSNKDGKFSFEEMRGVIAGGNGVF
jgi:Ca2+-binding EF-hand superfamily protein